jgi:hypothetical protein
VVVPPLLPVALLPAALVVMLRQQRRRRKRRKRVRHTRKSYSGPSLTIVTEKEESDEDMGFGLFD